MWHRYSYLCSDDERVGLTGTSPRPSADSAPLVIFSLLSSLALSSSFPLQPTI